MSQSDFGTINPATKSGTALASDLNSFRDALNTMHSGGSQPSYIQTGMLWADSSSADLEYKAFDGSASISFMQMDASANTMSFFIGGNQVDAFLDEDDMASDSATAVPSQQSVKAYVDALPFQESYSSSAQTITSAGSLSLTHGLSSAPSLVQLRLRCAVAEGGYSINDEVLFSLSAEFDKGISCVIGATNIDIRFGSNSGLCELPNKSTGTRFRITNSRWRLLVNAWA